MVSGTARALKNRQLVPKGMWKPNPKFGHDLLGAEVCLGQPPDGLCFLLTPILRTPAYGSETHFLNLVGTFLRERYCSLPTIPHSQTAIFRLFPWCRASWNCNKTPVGLKGGTIWEQWEKEKDYGKKACKNQPEISALNLGQALMTLKQQRKRERVREKYSSA